MFPRRGPQFNGEPADVWVPIAFTDRDRLERGSMHNNSVIARLKPGVSFQAVQAELDVLAERIAANYPSALRNAGFSLRLFPQPLREEISGRFEAPLLMLLAAVGLVLLVACANVANLILSRVAARTREFAVRTALGARHAQLVQLLLCEALLLSLAGGVAGIAIAYWAVKAAPAVLTRSIPGLHDLSIDFRVLAFTGAMCLATAVIFALVPLPTLDRRNPVDSLREDPSRTTSGIRKAARPARLRGPDGEPRLRAPRRRRPLHPEFCHADGDRHRLPARTGAHRVDDAASYVLRDGGQRARVP